MDLVTRGAIRGLGIGMALMVFQQASASFAIVNYSLMTFSKVGASIDPHISSITLAVVLLFGSTFLFDQVTNSPMNELFLFNLCYHSRFIHNYLFGRQHGPNRIVFDFIVGLGVRAIYHSIVPLLEYKRPWSVVGCFYTCGRVMCSRICICGWDWTTRNHLQCGKFAAQGMYQFIWPLSSISTLLLTLTDSHLRNGDYLLYIEHWCICGCEILSHPIGNNRFARMFSGFWHRQLDRILFCAVCFERDQRPMFRRRGNRTKTNTN